MSIQPAGGRIQNRVKPTVRQWITWIGTAVVLCVVVYFLMTYFFAGASKKEETADIGGFGGLPLQRPAELHAVPPPARVPVNFSPAPRLPSLAKPETFYADGDVSLAQNGGGSPPAQVRGGLGGIDEGTGADGADEFSKELTHSSDLGRAARATVMPHPELTIPAGTVIPCTLQTAINSQLKGLVDCLIPTDVRGATGTVTLLPRGSQVFGEVRSGLHEGQDRLFILWVRARRPDNIVITLDSPAADERGTAGISGYVNDYFWSRLLAATLYSFIEYGPQLVNSAIQNGNRGSDNNYTTILTPQQSLAGTVLNSKINIPPTLEQNQGAHESIFVARDLDFSGVLDLETVNLPGHG